MTRSNIQLVLRAKATENPPVALPPCPQEALPLTSVASPLHWMLFALFVAGLLALDLGVFHRKPHALGFREAAGWSLFWIGLSLAFNAFVWMRFGATAGAEFMAGTLAAPHWRSSSAWWCSRAACTRSRSGALECSVRSRRSAAWRS